MLRLAAVFFALSLASSAQGQPIQPPVAASSKSAVKKPASSGTTSVLPAAPVSGPCIGVFPLLGDRFQVKKIGITVFGNEFKEVAVDNWGLDDLVVERVRAAVGPGIAVRRIAYTKGAFDGYVPGIGIFQNNDSKAPGIVRGAAGQTHCERYVVVTKAVSQYVGNQSIYGVGIVNSGGPLLSRTNVHAMVRVHVHDGQTFAVLKSGNGSITGHNFLTGPPTRKVDDALWPEPPESANKPAMREIARSLLTEVLNKSLPELLAR